MPGRIVVGIDGSAQSRAALAWALREATTTGAHVEVVHSWHASDAEAAHLSALEAVIDREQPAREMVASAVEQAVADLPGDAPPIALELTDAPAKRALCDSAHGADLVVVGAQGHGAISGALMGSVSQHVVAHAPCTVVLVR